MTRLVSFHPVEPGFFSEVVQPLVGGVKLNPEPFLARALKHRVGAWAARRYVATLDGLLEQSAPPPPPQSGSMWEKIRARLEVFDFKADPLATMVKHAVQRDLHVNGRPFLIADESPEAVSRTVDRYRSAATPSMVEQLVEAQLLLMNPKLAGRIQPDSDSEMPPDLGYKAELMDVMRELYDLAAAARRGDLCDDQDGQRVPATTVLPDVLPWRAAWLHSRIQPFWMARDVDGLSGICRAAGMPGPEDVMPAWTLLGDICEEFPRLRETMSADIRTPQSTGAYVAPDDIPALLRFLKEKGAGIIQAATRHGEGRTCATLLSKIRECATYAGSHGLGYLEASGIEPVGPGPLPEDDLFC